jgi:hypothetical protein
MFNNLLCKLGDWSLRRSGPSSHTYLPIVRDNPFSEAGATVRAGARTFPWPRLVGGRGKLRWGTKCEGPLATPPRVFVCRRDAAGENV